LHLIDKLQIILSPKWQNRKYGHMTPTQSKSTHDLLALIGGQIELHDFLSQRELPDVLDLPLND